MLIAPRSVMKVEGSASFFATAGRRPPSLAICSIAGPLSLQCGLSLPSCGHPGGAFGSVLVTTKRTSVLVRPSSLGP